MLTRLVSRLSGIFGSSDFDRYLAWLTIQNPVGAPARSEALRDYVAEVRRLSGYP